MPISPISVTFNHQKKYDEIIDVRSENEFLEDHIPGAINLPVLNNEERKEVGTIYKQISAFEARKLGASLVFKNISHHLKNYFLDKQPRYSPLIYCWRGGQRSNSLAITLSQIGWQVNVLEGGYKTYRHYVIKQLETLPLTFNYHILCGLTGSGKTYLLHQLAAQGYQILDLEKIANHRGSLLGQEFTNKLESQPSQKYFDSLLLQQLQMFCYDKTIWIESESYKIGNVYLPPNLWQKMKQSPCFEIQLPLEKRVDFLLEQYAHFRVYPEQLKENIKFLKSRYGWDKIVQWFSWIDQEQWREFVEDLLLTHYDPAYERSLEKTYTNQVQKIQLSTLEPDLFLKALKKS
ncbi:tRNA 2-selenouridine(34) synthase MnmH [Crocosphaera sp. UHCC 0190]|uniref:tRNA 2-selenouridine(34) synthase MnmH n=1 Tax=Crocosphaera sp. UHCC 0190 TaxID=3110246 RepID=UPI002B204461|nr:tRNA 2-selenouridine(34) synthase MnmH [Crocosphaera sp. UHCC 0190]MEA5509569.1 tRNA 2-selenouridine(34) synthase MnmH [Crocosphaera sp. UHCC 0190]